MVVLWFQWGNTMMMKQATNCILLFVCVISPIGNTARIAVISIVIISMQLGSLCVSVKCDGSYEGIVSLRMGSYWPWRTDQNCWHGGDKNPWFSDALTGEIYGECSSEERDDQSKPCWHTYGPDMKLEPNPDENELNHSNSYARLLGSLQYITNSTWLDICYAINKLATYTTNPGLQHYRARKWILRFLAGTKTLGIIYKNSQDMTDDNNLFDVCANTAYTNAADLKSMTGYVFLAAGGAIRILLTLCTETTKGISSGITLKLGLLSTSQHFHSMM
jgi:hypothetical protein